MVIAAGATAFALGGQTPAPEPTPTVVQIAEVTPAPKATPTPTPEPVVEVAVPAPEPVQVEVPPQPVLCPEGTIANHVDEYGNESNCHDLNDQGQQCVKYGEGDQCVAWLED